MPTSSRSTVDFHPVFSFPSEIGDALAKQCQLWNDASNTGDQDPQTEK